MLPDGSVLTLSIRDEACKIDLNAATDDLLRHVLVGFGATPDEASALTDAIVDFRDADSLRRLNGAKQRAYAAAGLYYGPKNARFDLVEELEQVAGLPCTLYEHLRPVLAVHSKRNGIDVTVVSPELKQVLTRGTNAFSRRFVAPCSRRVFKIRATVSMKPNVRLVRLATVDVTSGGRLHKILRWAMGRAGQPSIAIDELELC